MVSIDIPYSRTLSLLSKGREELFSWGVEEDISSI